MKNKIDIHVDSVLIASILVAVAAVFAILWFSLKMRILFVEKKRTLLGRTNKNNDTEYQQGLSINRHDGFSKLSRNQSSSINYQSSVPSMNTQVQFFRIFDFFQH